MLLEMANELLEHLGTLDGDKIEGSRFYRYNRQLYGSRYGYKEYEPSNFLRKVQIRKDRLHQMKVRLGGQGEPLQEREVAELWLHYAKYRSLAVFNDSWYFDILPPVHFSWEAMAFFKKKYPYIQEKDFLYGQHYYPAWKGGSVFFYEAAEDIDADITVVPKGECKKTLQSANSLSTPGHLEMEARMFEEVLQRAAKGEVYFMIMYTY